MAYANEIKVFKQVCVEVRENVEEYARKYDQLLTSNRIRSVFFEVLNKTYRKADKYVTSMIKRHASISPISPPSSSDTVEE